MTVMKVGRMSMGVDDQLMSVRMSVRFVAGRVGMIMLMVVVMRVAVVVFEHVVNVGVVVPFRQEQPRPQDHECRGDDDARRERVTERHGNQRAGEWCYAEHGGLPGGAEETERVGVENDAASVTDST